MPLTAEDAIARANEALETVISDYPDHLASTLDEIEQKAANGQWEDIKIITHDLKGQAGTVGWPMVGHVARSFSAALETGATDCFPEAARVHLECLQLCLKLRMRTLTPEGNIFLDELARLEVRMRRHSRHAA